MDVPVSMAGSGTLLESFSPATGELLGAVPTTAARDVAAAVDESAAVQRLWAQLRPTDRARYMQRAAQAVIDEFDELVELVCREQGRPRVETELMELLPAIETLQWLADAGPKVLAGEKIGLSRVLHPVKRARWSYEPLGVVGVLGPATEPFSTPLGDVAVALTAGNGVVLKPSPYACLAGERIARVFARAGLPEGLLHVVHGHADVGGALVEAAVAQVRFTGSFDAGRAVGEACARGLKRSVLELGGKDAMIVCADAELPRAVHGAAWGAFANAGQCGGSIERAYVLREVADRFLADVVAAARTLTLGDPLDPSVAIGPLVGRERLDRLQELIGDAVRRGAVLHCGGPARVEGLRGAFFAPAVLTGVTSDMLLAREEAPGPLLAVTAVESEEEAIAGANDSALGLGASVWTEDRYKGGRIAAELRVGMVWMNDHLVTRSAPQIPWGGVRASGIGRARGAIALRTCAEPKVVTWDPPRGRPFWWFPYDAALAAAAEAIARMRSARDPDRERALRQGALPVLRVAARTIHTLRRGRR
jgi:acyl-CoA reductase-like NAD-dependent aldehyde dehydrogenase